MYKLLLKQKNHIAALEVLEVLKKESQDENLNKEYASLIKKINKGKYGIINRED